MRSKDSGECSWVSDILRGVASDERPRADVLESFIFPPRRKKPILGINSVGATFHSGRSVEMSKERNSFTSLGTSFFLDGFSSCAGTAVSGTRTLLDVTWANDSK